MRFALGLLIVLTCTPTASARRHRSWAQTPASTTVQVNPQPRPPTIAERNAEIERSPTRQIFMRVFTTQMSDEQEDQELRALLRLQQYDGYTVLAHDRLAWHHYQRREYAQAIQHYNATIELGTAIKSYPTTSLNYDGRDFIRMYEDRLRVWTAWGKYREARADAEFIVEHTRELRGHFLDVDLLARLLAAAPDEAVRDGARATELAKQACELTKWEDISTIETLAAAYAEAGRWDQALEMQQRALRAETARQQQNLAELTPAGRKLVEPKIAGRLEPLQQRLKLYESHQPLRLEAGPGNAFLYPNSIDRPCVLALDFKVF
jgi:tetratricopeptide (TPR) repeat protein